MSIIGVTPIWDDDKESIWMLPGYLEGIRNAGGTPIILPLTTDNNEIHRIFDICDGFLFTGGHDVTPELYNEQPLKNLVSTCEKRDTMEMALLRLAIQYDKSVLGICRGIQFINAALGGTLYQDIPIQHPSELEHHQSAPYDIPVHKVIIKKGSPLYNVLNTTELPVNSYHHQAVKVLAPCLKDMASATDGLIEAVYKPDHKFLWAVQWHPEFSYKTDKASQTIFSAFVDSVKD